jgi:tetratricopeptide (TPR) repeat protein
VRLWRAAIDPEAKAFRTELDPDEPDSPMALLDAAARLMSMGRTEESEGAYEASRARLEKLVSAFRNDADYANQLAVLAPYYRECGRAYGRLNRWDKADAEFAKAIELQPDSYAYWADHGTALREMKQWGKAIAVFSKSLELRSGFDWVWIGRGNTYAELGQWKEAMADFSKAVELSNGESDSRYLLALAHLRVADVVGYRKLCTEMLEQFDLAAKTDSAHWALWTCALAADAVADWKVPQQLAEKALTANPKSYRFLNDHGVVLYRAGQYQRALERLTEAEMIYQLADHKQDAIAYNWLFLAMAHHRLRHVPEAQKWHQMAVQWIDQEMQKSKEAAAANPLPWNRRLTLQLLRRETEQLLAHQSRF